MDAPGLYLITPPSIDLAAFSDQLVRVLDCADIACLRYVSALEDEDEIRRQADHLRALCHERDVALVIADHYRLVEPLGLDGVHLTGTKSYREARKALGPDPIIGCYCAQSRHDGMTAGELGSAYVSFGPVGASNLGDGTSAPLDLFEWWSAMIEVPLVAEGNMTPESIASLRDQVDFIGLGAELWAQDAPDAYIKSLV